MRGRLLGVIEVLAERSPQIAHHVVPLALALFDVVELFLHPGGEADVEHTGEGLDE